MESCVQNVIHCNSRLPKNHAYALALAEQYKAIDRHYFVDNIYNYFSALENEKADRKLASNNTFNPFMANEMCKRKIITKNT